MKKNNIGVLITIIILLCIFLPGAIYGTYMHHKVEKNGENPNKELYYDGKLYFYNANKLIGTYTCETEKCGYAKNSINNMEFESFNQTASEIKLINNKYAFINDGEKILLYDVIKEMKIIDYKEVKNYSFGIDNDYYLVKTADDLWGMIQVNENISVAIQAKYQYLGLKGELTEKNIYNAQRVIAKTEEDWKLITNEGSIIISLSEMIVDYSDYFIVTANNQIYDYNNNPVLSNYQINNIQLLNRVAIALTNSGVYFIYDSQTSSIIETLPTNNNGEYIFNIENNALVVTQNNNVIETIALN